MLNCDEWMDSFNFTNIVKLYVFLLSDPAGGGSYDWAKGTAGVPFSFTLELRDRGRYGFLLPRSQIIPTGEETFDAILATAESVAHQLRLT